MQYAKASKASHGRFKGKFNAFEDEEFIQVKDTPKKDNRREAKLKSKQAEKHGKLPGISC